MRIGFDGKRAVQNNTGLGNYSRYILEILGKYYPENEYYIFAPKQKENVRLQRVLQRYPFLKMTYPSSAWKIFSKIWRFCGINGQLRTSAIDVFHGLSNELPVNIRKAGMKSVVTIHDLIFLRYPSFYKPIDRAIYTYKFRKACENADRIIAVSECTKKDVIELFRIPESKITTIYQGCDGSFLSEASDEKKAEVRAKYHLPQRYILNVGSIEERKNVWLAVKAIETMAEDIFLVIVGRWTHYADEVKEYVSAHHLTDRVVFLTSMAFTDLPAVYQQAEVFVYPSLYEGFGIPIVEALNSGVPVVAATQSCLQEAGGPTSLYVDPHDAAGLKEILEKILSDTVLRSRMIESGREYARKFSEKNQAEALMNLYKSLLLE